MEATINGYKERFKELIADGKFSRLGRNFSTTRNKYFYDTGTGKVFRINENIDKIVSAFIKTNKFESIYELGMEEADIKSALDELFDTVDKQHILQAPPVKELFGPQVYDLDREVSKERSQLTLEVTEECNMRCKYCIYHEGNGGYREFGNRMMTFDIAKKALDSFIKNSGKEELFVSFYGGEPLVNFKLIKECIDYCSKEYPDKNIQYTMTTNATLMTKEIAEYLAKLPRTAITVSLDGPKELHDKYRVLRGGEGSFDKTIRGLKYLVDAFGDRAGECVLMNSVMAEVNEANLEKTEAFFEGLEWLPKGVIHTTAYVDTPDEEVDYQGVDGERETKIRERIANNPMNYHPIGTWGTRKLKDGNGSFDDVEEIAKEEFIKDLLSVHKRFRVDEPSKIYGMNGCCVPGGRKLYVTVTGEYRICEKMGPSPAIGNVNDGIDIEKIRKEYVNDFINEAVKYCKDCWAINLCNVCYTECYDENGVNFKKRFRRCESHRVSKEQVLAEYHEILEKDPEKLEFLNTYELA